MNEEILEKLKRDDEMAEGIKHIIAYPIDIPSLVRQVFWNNECGDEPFASDGHRWKDKPHNMLSDLIREIRTLRSYIILNEKEEIKETPIQ
jgi:hypothetical protein